jgi:hypothetical protein
MVSVRIAAVTARHAIARMFLGSASARFVHPECKPYIMDSSQNDRKPNAMSSGKSVPAWLPISLVHPLFTQILPFSFQWINGYQADEHLTLQLAVTTAALAVPIVLLRRQRSNALLNTIPPRRTGDLSSLASRFTPIQSTPPSNVNGSQWPPPRRRNGGTTSFHGSRFTPRASVSAPLSLELDELPDRARSNDEFNTPLYAAKAFGLATLIVMVCASTAVWGVKTSLGVKDVRLFLPPNMRLTVTGV